MSAFMRLYWIPELILKPSSAMPTRSLPIISAFAASRSGRTRVAAHGRHQKLKRAAIKEWVASGATPPAASTGDDPLQSLLARFAGSRSLDGSTSIEGLGLELARAGGTDGGARRSFQTRIDETKFAGAKTLDELRSIVTAAPQQAEVAPSPSTFHRGTVDGSFGASGASARQRGSCRSAASLLGCAWPGSRTSRVSAGPSSSPPIIKAT